MAINALASTILYQPSYWNAAPLHRVFQAVNRVFAIVQQGCEEDSIGISVADAIDQVLGGPGLTVNVASPKWMLAMKARAARGRRDLDDIWVLCQILSIRAVDDVWTICHSVWGDVMIRDDVIELVTADLQTRGLR